MSRRFRSLPLLVVAASALGAAAACSDEGSTPREPDIDYGGALYARYCASCHGDAGEGYSVARATALAAPEFLSTASDAFLSAAIEVGRPGTAMSPWSDAFAGPLDDEEIEDLVAFLRTWQTRPSVLVDEVTVEGVPERAVGIYDASCAQCHGEAGEGISAASLADPAFLESASDGFLRHAIARGRARTRMAGYEAVLTAQAIDDLVALIRSWEVPFDGLEEAQPPPLPRQVVVHPGGRDAIDWFQGEHYVTVEELKSALDFGVRMVLLDVRPPPDYLREHIAGAISMPFYRIDSVVGALPADVWLVAYGCCPTKLADLVAEILSSIGLTRVVVLDGGFGGWEVRGYPTSEGTAP